MNNLLPEMRLNRDLSQYESDLVVIWIEGKYGGGPIAFTGWRLQDYNVLNEPVGSPYWVSAEGEELKGVIGWAPLPEMRYKL